MFRTLDWLQKTLFSRFPFFRFLSEGVLKSAKPLTGIKDLNSFSSYCMKWVTSIPSGSISVDLGCGPSPRNPFGAEILFGLDLEKDTSGVVCECNLGFETLPFEDNSIDYVTALDLIEHIPRHARTKDTPFIFLVNEVFRILKPAGIFFSVTPVYPFKAAFQDPTHNNIVTVDTFPKYFSNNSLAIAKHYGINARFEICEQRIWGSHLVAVLRK